MTDTARPCSALLLKAREQAWCTPVHGGSAASSAASSALAGRGGAARHQWDECVDPPPFLNPLPHLSTMIGRSEMSLAVWHTSATEGCPFKQVYAWTPKGVSGSFAV